MSPAPRVSPRQRGNLVRTQGVVAPGDLQIYMPRPIFEDLVDYARRDRQRVRGGMILGYAGEQARERWIEARVHVPAENGIGDGTKFNFSEACLEDLSDQRDTLWPDTTVVGWYYTHLGSGIFLSNTDLQSHRTHFNLPHQIVLVIDAIQGTLGFFQWKGAQVVPSGFHFFEPDA